MRLNAAENAFKVMLDYHFGKKMAKNGLKTIFGLFAIVFSKNKNKNAKRFLAKPITCCVVQIPRRCREKGKTYK